MARTLYILTDSEWGDWLPFEIVKQSDTGRLVWRAEQKLIDKYQGAKTSDAVIEDGVGTFSNAQVQLEGWAEDSDGNPDTASMPDDLVQRLRDCVARIVMHWDDAPDPKIESRSQGSKSVSYSKGAGSLPRSVWRPLRRYDERTPYSPAV